MARDLRLITDEQWKIIEPLLPEPKASSKGGAPRRKPRRLIADKAYDADGLRILLRSRGIELICPHRHGRKRPALQDGRALRRYKRRWKIERTIAWLGYYRRLLIRWERNVAIYRAFMHVACLMIAVRWL